MADVCVVLKEMFYPSRMEISRRMGLIMAFLDSYKLATFDQIEATMFTKAVTHAMEDCVQEVKESVLQDFVKIRELETEAEALLLQMSSVAQLCNYLVQETDFETEFEKLKGKSRKAVKKYVTDAKVALNRVIDMVISGIDDRYREVIHAVDSRLVLDPSTVELSTYKYDV